MITLLYEGKELTFDGDKWASDNAALERKVETLNTLWRARYGTELAIYPESVVDYHVRAVANLLPASILRIEWPEQPEDEKEVVY